MFFFLCYDPPHTEIYTDVHTLSRHDALPITRSPITRTSKIAVLECRVSPTYSVGRNSILAILSCLWNKQLRKCFIGPWFAGPAHTRLHQKSVPRSEEHTSELQSLMRTSHAVFCLTKKNQLSHHTPSLH